MARESTTIESESEMSAAFEQLRSGLIFLPLIIGLTRPLLGSGPDRVVLVNPGTQGMIVLDGDATMITEMLGGRRRIRRRRVAAGIEDVDRVDEVGGFSGAARNGGGGVLCLLGCAEGGGDGEGDAVQAPVPWPLHREVAEDARVVPGVPV